MEFLKLFFEPRGYAAEEAFAIGSITTIASALILDDIYRAIMIGSISLIVILMPELGFILFLSCAGIAPYKVLELSGELEFGVGSAMIYYFVFLILKALAALEKPPEGDDEKPFY